MPKASKVSTHHVGTLPAVERLVRLKIVPARFAILGMSSKPILLRTSPSSRLDCIPPRSGQKTIQAHPWPSSICAEPRLIVTHARTGRTICMAGKGGLRGCCAELCPGGYPFLRDAFSYKSRTSNWYVVSSDWGAARSTTSWYAIHNTRVSRATKTSSGRFLVLCHREHTLGRLLQRVLHANDPPPPKS